MESALVPLVSVLLGAVLGGGASLLVERHRDGNSRRAELLGVRRTVELDALDEVHRTISTFHDIFVHNHDGTDVEEDAAQAAAFEHHVQQLDSLEMLANRVHVLASPEIASIVQRVRDTIFNYLTNFDTGEGIFRAVEINAIRVQLDVSMVDLRAAIRVDLRTSELDEAGS